MEGGTTSWSGLAKGARKVVQRFLAVGGNRLDLLEVETHEARDGLVRSICLVLGAAAFGFLGVLTMTTALVLLWWDRSPVAVLLTLTGVYGAAAGLLFWKLRTHQRDWKIFPETVEQLRKDRAALEKQLT